MKLRLMRILSWIFLSAGICLFSASAFAQDPQFETCLKKVYDTYHSMKTASVSINIQKSMDIKDEEDVHKKEETIAYDVSLARPNQIYIKDGDSQGIMVSNGKTLYVYFPEMEVVLKQPAPKKLSDFPDFFRKEPVTVVFYLAFSDAPVLTQVFHAVPYKEVKAMYPKGKYLGEDTLNGKKTWKLLLDDEDVIYTVWVNAGPKAVIEKVSIEMTEQGLKKEDNLLRYSETAQFKNWKLDEKLPKKIFEFTPPTDKKVKTVSSFSELTKEIGGVEEGSTAPDFNLKQLGGEPVLLSHNIGKNVVILDFWATWCPPCRTLMPMMEHLAAEYQGENVVFYSVNEKEDEKKINLFLSRQGLKPTVLLDLDGAVGHQYGVHNIPHLFIIGKDGKLKKEFAGVPANFEQTMKTLIEKER